PENGFALPASRRRRTMSPSGSSMQTAGTSIVARSFCRRASRRSASGRKTEGDDGFLFSSSGGMVLSERSALEDNPAVIGRQFDKFRELEFARFDRLNGLLRRHPQFRLWAARLAEDRCFFTCPLVPVDDGKTALLLQCLADRLRESEPVRNAVRL